MSSSVPLPRLGVKSRQGSRTPDVSAVMQARLTFSPLFTGVNSHASVASWPSPAKEKHHVITSSQIDQLGRAPHLHVRLTEIVESGVKTLKTAYPNLQIPPIEWMRPAERKTDRNGTEDLSALPTAAHVNEALLEEYVPEFHPVAFDAHRLASVIAERRTHLGLASRDSFGEEEDAAIGRFEVIRHALSVFGSVFKSHRSFIEMATAEASRFVTVMYEIMQRRSLHIVEQGKAHERQKQFFTETEEQLRNRVQMLEQTVVELEKKVESASQTDTGGERRAMLLDALLAEKTADLADRENVIAIQSRKLFEAEKQLALSEANLAVAASNMVALNKQLLMRQQVIDKLNFSNEQLYAERTALQRQVVQQARRGVDPSPNAQRRVIPMASASAQIAGLEAFFSMQSQCMEELTSTSLRAFSEASHRGMLTPRPADHQMEVDGNGSLHGTAAKFVDMQHRLSRLNRDLSEVRRELDDALQMHGSLVIDKTARFTVPGVIQALGPRYLPPAAEIWNAPPKWFISLGEDEAVPDHLKAQSGKVRNLRLNRSMVVKYAVQFLQWLLQRRTRAEYVEIGGSNTFFASQLAIWISEIFNPDEVVSFAYSFHEGLRLFSYEARCGFAFELLDGRVSFDVYIAVEDWIDRVREMFLRAARDVDARLSKKEALALLERGVHALQDDDIARVMAALTKDHAGDGVNVTTIFGLDPKGNERLLPQMLREVILRDRQTLLREVESAILDDSTTSRGVVTPHTITVALLTVDPKRSSRQVETILTHVFGADSMQQTISVADQETPLRERFVFCGETVPLPDALFRIRQVLFGRWSKRKADGNNV